MAGEWQEPSVQQISVTGADHAGLVVAGFPDRQLVSPLRPAIMRSVGSIEAESEGCRWFRIPAGHCFCNPNWLRQAAAVSVLNM